MDKLYGNSNTSTRIYWTDGRNGVKKGCYIFTNVGPVGPISNIKTPEQAEQVAKGYKLVLMDN